MSAIRGANYNTNVQQANWLVFCAKPRCRSCGGRVDGETEQSLFRSVIRGSRYLLVKKGRPALGAKSRPRANPERGEGPGSEFARSDKLVKYTSVVSRTDRATARWLLTDADLTTLQHGGPAARIQAPTARPEGDKLQEAARHGDVLEKIDHLVL